MPAVPIRPVLITVPQAIASSPTAPPQNAIFVAGLQTRFAMRGMHAVIRHVETGVPAPKPGVDADIVVVYHGVFDEALPGRWTCKVGPLPDLFWVDPCGYARYAAMRILPGDIAEDPDTAIAWAERMCRRLACANASKYNQPPIRRLERRKGTTVFVPLQVPGDVVLQGGIGVVDHLLFVVDEIATTLAKGAVPTPSPLK